MDDQKVMKKRLKVLMQRPENQVCSDCPQAKPLWASLIVPPPGAPPGTLPIGAFCCLECSGSHRRLGVHISFVRSINLDSWKEKEVIAMENGGNAKVNAIFEATLNREKPGVHADGPTRERFIRDKYERRKFYDPAAFSHLPHHHAPPPPTRSQSMPTTQQHMGPPSDAARQRIESRRAKLKKANSQESFESTGSSSGRRRPPRRTESSGGGSKSTRRLARPVAPAPTSAPVDLLDFGASASSEPSPAPAPSADPFADFASSAPSMNKDPPRKAVSDDIMSLYSNNNNFGAMNQMTAQMGAMNFNNTPMMQQMKNPMMQQQQQQQQFGMNQGFGGFSQQGFQNTGMGFNNGGGFHNNGFDTDFGSAPMGSGPPLNAGAQRQQQKKEEKEDPFAQFGMNAFR